MGMSMNMIGKIIYNMEEENIILQIVLLMMMNETNIKYMEQENI